MLKKNKFIIFVFIFFPLLSFAATLELTKGHDARVPIAIAQFSGEPMVSQVVGKDLTNVGRFQVQTVQSGSLPHDVDEVDFSRWRGMGVDDLLVGSVKHQSNGKFLVSFSLLDLFNQGGAGASMDPVLVSKQYEVNSNQLRAVAHAISNDVYYELTGESGAFATRLAYVLASEDAKRYYLKVSDYDGYNAKTLVSSPVPIMSPRWSPNGRQIAYVTFGDKGSEVYVVNIFTGKRTLLVDFPGLNAAPAWAPNGKQMAVVLSKSGAQDIYLLDLSQQSMQKLTHGTSIDTEPTFAPNGKLLAFVSNRQGSPEIYLLDLETGDVNRVTYDSRYNTTPAFMPNGKALVMIHKVGSLYAVALQNLQTNVLKVLTKPGLLQSPTVAPNGSMIIYANQNGGDGRLLLVASNGKAHASLPKTVGNMQEPAWSPFVK